MDKIRDIIDRIIGYILFIPMLISIAHFINLSLTPGVSSFIFQVEDIVAYKDYAKELSYSPYNPVYVGLLALAGAYLIKNDKK